MNIADFVERGNPEDSLDEWNDELGPISGSEASESPKTRQNSALQSSLQPKNLIIIVILVLVSSAAFGLGILAEQGSGSANGAGLLVGAAAASQSSAQLTTGNAVNTDSSSAGSASPAKTSAPEGGEVIGSSSTHQYYLPWCSGATSISKTDTVWFATTQMAKSAGYTAGPNCAGI